MSDYEFVNGWVIRETAYAPSEETSKATVFALANGYMGLRGAGEELSPGIPGAKGAYINGIYDTPAGKLTEREFPNVQDWMLIEFSIDGEPFDLSTGEIIDYSRELDMREAVVRRSVRWRSLSGRTIRLASERFLSMSHIHTGAVRWTLTADQDCTIELRSSIDAAVSNRWADHFRGFAIEREGDTLYLETETFDPGFRIGVMVTNTLHGPQDARIEHATPTDRRVETVHTFALRAGKSATLTKLAALHESRFTDGSIRSACRTSLAEVTALGYEEAKAAHARRWAELWEGSDVVIEGDDDAQMGARFSVFHLLASAPYHNDRISIPARGLQGQDYYGSIFWDCEVFVLPLLSYTQPAAARNILGYRIHTLNGARRKAAGMGYRGAYYAWQSQETGDEQCDLYVFPNPLTGELIRSYFADEQIHISADIAYAAWQYYQATGDEDFWAEGGAEMAVEIARFFVSRATWNEREGRFEILTVLGPDEYHERVDNNAFTNALAGESVRIAGEVVSILKDRWSAEYGTLAEKTGLTDDEVDGWQDFIAKLYIPSPDPETQLIEQFDGYFALEDVSVEETRKRLAHPDLHPGGPLGPFQSTQNIKQADVTMLLYLLRDRYDTDTKRLNWDYYEIHTAHDSSLSPMAYSLVAADVGMRDWAYKYFMYTSHIDLASYGPHWNLGIHAASLGGAWLDLVHGFCKLVLRPDGVHVTGHPELPEHWKRVEFAFTWHGQRMRYETDGEAVELVSLGEKEVPVRFPGGDAVLAPGARLRWDMVER